MRHRVRLLDKIGSGDSWKIGSSKLRQADGMKLFIGERIAGYRQEEDLKCSLFIKNHILRWFISWGEVLQMNLDIFQLSFIHQRGNWNAVWEPHQVRNDSKCGISKS